MRLPLRAAALAAAAAALAVCLSACGSAMTTTTTAPTTTTGLEGRLPAADAIPGVTGDEVQRFPTAEQMVDELYSEGDTAKPAAVRRYTAGGFRGGVVRDQQGTKPGPTFFRAYVMQLGSPAAAAKEADASTVEVASSKGATSTPFTVAGIPGAHGLDIAVNQGGNHVRILFVTFAGGPYLYGYQAITLAQHPAPRAAVLAAAQEAYRRSGGAP